MAGAFSNRLSNLDTVLKNYASLVDAAREAGVSANYLSQLKGGKRMGHVMARRLEQGLGLQLGWLDLDHSALVSQLLDEQQLTVQVLQLSDKSRLRILKKLVASLPD